MRRVVLLLFVLFLVNLPFVSQVLAERRLANEGRDVAATVLDARRVDGRNYVDYRLPEDIDPKGGRYSAQVDDATFDQARSSDVLPVRVVPDDPATNRPDGVATNRTFLVVAVLGDVVLLAIALLALATAPALEPLRGGASCYPGLATLRGTPGTLTAAVPEAWAAACPGGRARLRLLSPRRRARPLRRSTADRAEQRLSGAEYVARGRVVDTRPGGPCWSWPTASASAWRPGRTGSAPTSATRPRRVGCSASPPLTVLYICRPLVKCRRSTLPCFTSESKM